MKNKVIEVQNVHISISKQELDDYICITDIAKAKSGDSRCADIVKNWLRNRNTLEFLGTWEKIYNPDFKVVEFDHFKTEAGLHTFVLSVAEWINKTNAIGLYVKRGKYGGTYAHKDIDFEFASSNELQRKPSMAGICGRGGYIKCGIIWIYGESMERSKS